VLWVGGQGGMEADLVKRAGVPFAAIPAAGVHGVGLRSLPGNLARLARGTLASRRIHKQFKPDAILFTGGYVAVPMAVAARATPSLLYVPDIEPGLALKTLARFASTIALTAPDSRAFFLGSHARLEVTGYPTRPELAGWDRARGRSHLGLDPEGKVILVTGGSKGARTINRPLLAALPRLLESAQIIHLTGQLDWDEVEAARQQLPAGLAARYHAMPYLHEMGAALSAADLVVSRAGASCLGEYPLFGLPAVLIPYPYAWRYQKVNADYLVRQGAALMLETAELLENLLPTLHELLTDGTRLEQMRKSMAALARPQAAERIAALVKELPAGRPLSGGIA
jgi:undecaprenyldiphospho-muramoylpentapeptide beta-N-acetylglucosaminyltransferase